MTESAPGRPLRPGPQDSICRCPIHQRMRKAATPNGTSSAPAQEQNIAPAISTAPELPVYIKQALIRVF